MWRFPLPLILVCVKLRSASSSDVVDTLVESYIHPESLFAIKDGAPVIASEGPVNIIDGTYLRSFATSKIIDYQSQFFDKKQTSFPIGSASDSARRSLLPASHVDPRSQKRPRMKVDSTGVAAAENEGLHTDVIQVTYPVATNYQGTRRSRLTDSPSNWQQQRSTRRARNSAVAGQIARDIHDDTIRASDYLQLSGPSGNTVKVVGEEVGDYSVSQLYEIAARFERSQREVIYGAAQAPGRYEIRHGDPAASSSLSSSHSYTSQLSQQRNPISPQPTANPYYVHHNEAPVMPAYTSQSTTPPSSAYGHFSEDTSPPSRERVPIFSGAEGARTPPACSHGGRVPPSTESMSTAPQLTYVEGDLPGAYAAIVKNTPLSAFQGKWKILSSWSDSPDEMLTALGLSPFKRRVFANFESVVDVSVSGEESVTMRNYLPANRMMKATIPLNGKPFDYQEPETGMWTTRAVFENGKLVQIRKSIWGTMYDVRAVFLKDPEGRAPPGASVMLFKWTLSPASGGRRISINRWFVRT